MADVFRAVLPLVGYYFFGPVGALVGGLLADVLFPLPGVKGPRLNELNIQTSTVGAPIPIVYGTAALAGNVIWSGGLIETKHEDEQGGFLGIGGQEITTYSYSVDVAIGIAEGPISGIRRIWADANLIYDASNDETLYERFLGGEIDTSTFLEEIATTFLELITGIRAMSAQLNFDLYLGTEDQLPDPTIESYEGVGNVPGYRGLAYIVLTGFQLEKYGNRIPNFRFEVYTGAPTECGLYSAGSLYPWTFETDPNTWDPRNPLNSHLYSNSSGTLTEGTQSLLAALASMSASFDGRDFLVSAALGKEYSDNIYVQGWATSSTPNDIRPCSDDPPNADYLTIALSLNSMHLTPSGRYGCEGAGGPPLPSGGDVSCLDQQVTGALYAARSFYMGQLSGFYGRTDDGGDPATIFEGAGTAEGVQSRGNCSPPEPIQQWVLTDQELGVTRSILPPDPCSYGTPLAGAPGYCVFNGQITQGITWTPVSGTFKVLQRYLDNGGTPGLVSSYPVNPCLRSDDPNYNNQAYWEAAYADALAAGEPIAGGLTYGVDYPETTSSAYFSECETVDTECVPMALIVSDICRRAGLRTDTATQIDVSGLTTCVNGYIIGRQMSGRDALGPLRAFGLWDAVESQAVLTFVERGAALVETLTADDLGAHEAGSQAPSAVEVSRVQEKDLPRRLRLHFANFLHDHEPSEQAASRLSTEAVNELDVELPISMEPDTAAQLAEIMLYEAYVSRNTYRFALDNTWLGLEPTDCVEIPVDGQTQRVRIVSVDYSIGGIARIDAVADDDGSYTSTAVATPSQPSGGLPGSGGSALICPSGLVLLDIPRLATGHIDAGYYAAVYNTCGDDGWECAELYRSNDGGLTYGRVARTNGETTVGEIDSITGPATDPTLPGDSPPYDTTSSITVTLFEGTLASITDAQIDAGQNMAAIGVDGRWVIIQFKTATLDTGDQYTLTDLIWGLNGTEHLLGTTVDGDTFVLLSDSDLLRIPESADAIGVEKQVKIVTCGEAVDAVAAIDFTTWGLSYLRPCPSTVLSASLTEPPESATDGDAYLLPNDTSLSGLWADHGGEIASWSDETDNWVYCTPAPGTIIHIEGDTSTDPGDDVISPGGGGTPTPAPWTPAIPPLAEATPADSDYFVFHDGTTYKKGLLSTISGGGFDTSVDTSDIGIALDELTDVTIDSSVAEGDVLVYDGTNGWINAPVSSVIGSGNEKAQVADLVITSNATYQDTGVVIPNLQPGIYAIDAVAFFTSHVTPTGRMQIAFTGTASHVRSSYIFYRNAATTSFQGGGDAAFPLESALMSSTDTYNFYWSATCTVSVAGDLSLQAKQQVSSGTAVTFLRGSRMAVRLIS